MEPEPKQLSVMDAIEGALAHTRLVCFSPFDPGKWFTLGFCAFLAALGHGGAGWNGGTNFGRSMSEVGDKVIPWVLSHLVLVLTLGGAALLVGVALGVLFMWLGSRGQFMFLDGVARNRAEVSEPWHRFGRLAHSLFLYRLSLAAIGLGAVLFIAGAGLFAAWPSLAARVFDLRAVFVVIGGGCLLVPLALALAVIRLMLSDFVAPVMLRRNLGSQEAFRIFRREALSGHMLSFVLFYLMSFVIGIAAGTVILVGVCCTCCIAALPYISSVVFLPVTVFFRSYSLCFLGQLGEEWRLIGIPQPPPAAPEPPPPGPSAPPEDPKPEGDPAAKPSQAPAVEPPAPEPPQDSVSPASPPEEGQAPGQPEADGPLHGGWGELPPPVQH